MTPLFPPAPGNSSQAEAFVSPSLTIERGAGGGVRCHGLDLAAGDVVQIGPRRCRIVDICQPFLHSARHGTVRNALVCWLDGSVKPTPYRFQHFANTYFTITGGPKTLAPASQLRTMPAGYLLYQGATDHV